MTAAPSWLLIVVSEYNVCMFDANSQPTIIFTRTPAEQDRQFRAAMKIAQERMAGGKLSLMRPLVGGAVTLLGTCAVIITFAALHMPIPIDLIALPALGLLALFVIPWVVTWRGFRKLANSMQNVEHRVSLSDDGITVVTSKSTHVTAWQSIVEIARDGKDLKIADGDWNEFSIPLRAFLPGQADQFETTMRAMWEAHRHEATPAVRPPDQNLAYQLEWQLEAEDFLSLSRQYPAYRVIKILGLIMLAGSLYAIVVINGPLFLGNGWPFRGSSLSSILSFTPIIVIVLSFLWRPKAKLSGKEGRALREPTTVALTPAGFVQTRNGTETTIPWERIMSIVDKNGFVTFRTGKGPIAFVPARAFLDTAHRQAFIAAANAYHAGHPVPEYTVWPPAPGR